MVISTIHNNNNVNLSRDYQLHWIYPLKPRKSNSMP